MSDIKSRSRLTGYLSLKREDDLRIIESIARSRCEIPIHLEEAEITAARKGAAYLSGFHPEVKPVELSGILIASGHRESAVTAALTVEPKRARYPKKVEVACEQVGATE